MIDQQLMLPIGTVLHGDTYRVVRYIASGGFGNTYEVEHVKLGKRYCLKEFFMRGINLRRGTTVTVSVEDNRSTFEQMRTKFFKEAQRMARIDNPHVVEVTDCFEENATAYYVMKLIDGQSLSAKMAAQGRPFTEAEVRTMLPQVLSALRFVHNQGIYHLDLKPANIMTDAAGHLWLIDFGASRQLSAAESQTLSTSTGLCYTPNYAPSELVQGSTKYLGPWTDFYSLGATLYNLLTRQSPPEISEVEENGEKAFAFTDETSLEMQRLIIWLMQPRRNDRPQTADDINLSSEHTPYRLWWILAGVFVALVVLLVLLVTCNNRHIDVDYDDDEEEVDIYLVCPDSDHPHIIDLGLPSRTLWACCNVGAHAPQEYGSYYAWGETSEKNEYNWSTYVYWTDSDNDNRVVESELANIGSDIAGTQYDAATVNWGAPWQMPSSEQCRELISNCSAEWTTKKGVHGWTFKGSNGGTIFMPASGWRYDAVLDSVGIKGGYWSSTLNTRPIYGIRLVLRDDIIVNGLIRYFGQTIRPVCKESDFLRNEEND